MAQSRSTGRSGSAGGTRSRRGPTRGLVSGAARTAGGMAMLPVAVGERMISGAARGNPVPYYAGLGALAVVGVLEWPVAAVIGVGFEVARRAAANGSSARR